MSICEQCFTTWRWFDVLFVSFVRPQVVKTGGTPKVPDCFQRTPKKLCIPEKAEILAVNVDSKGVFLLLFQACFLV